MPSLFQLFFALVIFFTSSTVHAAGLIVTATDDPEPLEILKQTAVVVLDSSEQPGQAREDLLLRPSLSRRPDSSGKPGLTSVGLKKLAWIIPCPTDPVTAQEDSKLFTQLDDYVAGRLHVRREAERKVMQGTVNLPSLPEHASAAAAEHLEGTYSCTVLTEKNEGDLNVWLMKHGFKRLSTNAEVTLKFFRNKKYRLVCAQFTLLAPAVSSNAVPLPLEMPPLRMSFLTGLHHPLDEARKVGGRDGVYFPLKMSALQRTPMELTLHVFHPRWLNDNQNQYGYQRRNFQTVYRDSDSPQCVPEGGKNYAQPDSDPYLKNLAGRMPDAAAWFKAHHAAQKYYLNTLERRVQRPMDLEKLADDIWFFPMYFNVNHKPDIGFTPYDARADAPGSGAWPGEGERLAGENGGPVSSRIGLFKRAKVLPWPMLIIGVGVGILIIMLSLRVFERMKKRASATKQS